MFAMDRDRAAAGLVQAQTHNDLTAAYQTAVAAHYATYQVALGDANVAYAAAMAPVLHAQALAISAANVVHDKELVRINGDLGILEAENTITVLTARAPNTFEDVDPVPDATYGQPFSWQWFVGLAGVALVGIGTFAALAIGIPLLVAAFPVMCTVVTALAAIGLIITAISAASNVAGRFADGQTLTQSVGGGLADVTGINGMYMGIINRDIATGEHQHLSSEQMGASFGSGALQLIGTVTAVRGILRGFCFVGRTQVLIAEEEEQVTAAEASSSEPVIASGITSGTEMALATGIVIAGCLAPLVAKRMERKRASYKSLVDLVIEGSADDDWTLPEVERANAAWRSLEANPLALLDNEPTGVADDSAEPVGAELRAKPKVSASTLELIDIGRAVQPKPV